MKNLICFLLILSPVTTMASLKASECQSTNWEEKGREDGRLGKKIDLLYTYIKICDRANAPFSADLYRKGREEGLYTFCSNKNAYEMGLKKQSVKRDICPFNMFPDFQAFYERGVNYKKIEKQKIALDKKIAKLSETVAILENAKNENQKLEETLKELEFKPEMSETQIIKSSLMETMNQPLTADPGIETSSNTEKPLDLDDYPGDMKQERKPAQKMPGSKFE